jgi:3-phytase
MYTMDPATRRLVDVTARPIKTKMSFAYGSCMYRSAKTGKYYVIVNSYGGQVEQWELFDNGQGKVGGKLVRELDVGSRTEGCVADDEYGVLYIGEENVGIWKYTAEPDESWNPKRRLVAVLGPKGPISDDLNDDIEGLTLYHNSDGTGYLIASCQGKGTFVVFKREGDNDYVASFRIVDGNGIDAVSNTDGIDVTNFNLGPAFPQGLFVVHDGNNENGDKTNFKYVRWEAIAKAI